MFHELRYVYEVYREHSFSKAAKKLYIAQPSLSAMVRRAEQRIGGPIFDRSTSPVTLTSIGREYIRAAERIMEIENGFSQYMNDAGHCLTGAVSLGGTTLFTSYILPPLISAFSQKYPGVEIRLHETHTVALKRELSEGELDLIAENLSFDPNVYGCEPFREERLILMVPAALDVNRIAQSARLSAEDIRNDRHLPPNAPRTPLDAFRDEAFLLLKDGNDTRARAEKLCAAAGFRPKPRLLLDQQITAYNLATYGMGATFVSDTLVKSAPIARGAWFYPLDEAFARREICFFYKKNRYLSAAVRAFMNTVRDMSAIEK